MGNEFTLDEETRKALLGLMPCTDGATVPFTPPGIFDNIDEKYRPVFHQRAFNKEERDEYKLIVSESVMGGKKLDEITDPVEKRKEFDRVQTWYEKRRELARRTIVKVTQLYNPATGKCRDTEENPEGLDLETYRGFHSDIKDALYEHAEKISSLGLEVKQGLKS